MDENTQKVLDCIKGSSEPLKGEQVAEKTGLDRKIVDKAMDKLKKENLITSPKRCFWSAT